MDSALLELYSAKDDSKIQMRTSLSVDFGRITMVLGGMKKFLRSLLSRSWLSSGGASS
jgi:hypothetical protein